MNKEAMTYIFVDFIQMRPAIRTGVCLAFVNVTIIFFL